jgi:hypothetical protein
MSITNEQSTRRSFEPRLNNDLIPSLPERDSRVAFSIGYLTVCGHVEMIGSLEGLDDTGLELVYDAALNGRPVAKEDLLYLMHESA